jgi:iron(III) transport system substrate-binding protein
MTFRLPRSTIVVAAVSAFALLAAACGGDDSTTTTTAVDASPDTTAEPPATDAPAPTGTLTVYSGRGEDLVAPIIEQFSEATGIEVEVRYGNSAEMLLLIQEEGSNTPADVFYSQGAGFLGVLSGAGGLTTLPDDVLELVPESLRSPVGDWVGLSARARVGVYSTERVSTDDLPESLLDLTSPEWSGRVGWAPTNASLQDHVTAMRALIGEDATREWLEGMIANGVVPYENNRAILQAVADGEIDFGLTNHYYLYGALAEDPSFPVANHFFPGDEVSRLVNIAGAGVLTSSDRPDEAVELIRFLLSAEGQQYFASGDLRDPRGRRHRDLRRAAVDRQPELATVRPERAG